MLLRYLVVFFKGVMMWIVSFFIYGGKGDFGGF